MKRVLVGLLSAALIFSSFGWPVHAQGSDTVIDVMAETAQNAGKLDVVLQLGYSERAETLAKRNLSLTLLGAGGESYRLPLGSSGGEQEFSFGGKTVKVTLTLHNPQDAPLAGNDKVGFYLIEFSGLPRNSAYRVQLDGEGYRSFTSQEIAIEPYVPRLCVSAQSGGFALGDVTGDRAIDEADLNKVAGMLGSYAEDADLNLDGKLNITDVALIRRGMGALAPAEIYEGALVTSGILDTDTIAQELAQSGIQLEGALEDLFLDNGQAVKLTHTGEGECQIPITFETPKVMSTVRIVSPAVNGALEKGHVQVEYEDGTTERVDYDNAQPEGVHATERNAGESTVVIPLGKRVPVKKITITVEKTLGEDGKVRYVVVEKIEFLRDIIPPNIDLGASIPKNVQAVPGSQQVSLTWRAVDNVDGYLVQYGLSAGALNRQLRVGKNEAVVTGLENLKTYYFTVSAYNGDWVGDPSAAVSCIPQPDKAPLPPDNLSLTPEDSAIALSWKKAENAEFYNVYYKESAAESFELAAQKIAAASFTVTGLTNGVSYDFYVTAGNQIGFSGPSLTATGMPEQEILKIPTLPTRNRIPNSAIISAELENKNNVSNEYGGNFDIRWVYDGDFETHWTARVWWESSRITFEFDEEKSMDYLIYVPRLNKGFPESLQRYSVAAWDKDGNMTWLTADAGALTNRPEGNVGSAPIVRNNPKETGYAILPFERNDHIKKLAVLVRQGDGTPQPASLSEIAFYSYDDIDDSIASLFTDSTYTEVAPGATLEQVNELRARVESADGYYVNREILLDELALAESLLQGDTSQLGAVMDNVQSRDASGDQKRINTFQPLGVVAEAGKQVVVYAQIPQGETVSLVPTQHFAEAARWSGSAIQLQNGRNIITIPRINDVSPQKGGSLYLQYAGQKAGEIKMQVRGGTKIPLLELSDWHELDESSVKARISAYTSELERYYNEKLSRMNSGTLQTHFLNATEIAFPHVLLSLPASQIRAALGSNGTETLYNDGLAWEELMTLMYRTHGIDEAGLESSASRHNIRYMRMFSNAFMYASGSHIGIGFGSASGMAGGRPVSATGSGNANGLFGWGIQHEIGHVMDTLGKAEITNNIYSLFAQTYDGGENALASRLEKSNKYEAIFAKVTSGQQGMANDVFVSLGMYWQLHLAYDGAGDNFYHQLNQIYRSGGDAAFMSAASQVAGRDLSEFFRSWGMEPSGQSGAAEERKIQYLTDESRRERLKGTQRQSGTVGITAAYDRESREASVTVSPVSGAKMLGYEISRELNGKTEPVAFLSAASGKTVWTDSLGSVNNKAVTYSVKAVDILGYVVAEASAGQLDIAHDNLIARENYQWDSQTPIDGVLTAAFDGSLSVAGLRFNAFPEAGQPEESDDMTLGASNAGDGIVRVEVSTDGSSFTTVLEASCEELQANPGKLRFFTRKDADGSICPFDAKLIRLSGLPADAAAGSIDFAAYPGDYIEFGVNGIGILGESYEEISAGTLIVTGNFRGNPVFNTVRVYGKSQSGNMAQDSLTETEERIPLEGEVYLFAALPKEGDMAEIDNGLWIFVPKQQGDSAGALPGEDAEACFNSLLPTQIMAELHRTNVPEGGGNRVTSSTRWIPSPTYESMPMIILEE
ncbi:MAG: hypothetical protein HFG26_09630 [Provencibacterium sp.]|jgi:hypothetical protein|nr:hypothetical protein [Provencibacterium sp.]